MPELYWKEVNEPYRYEDERTGKVYEGVNTKKIVSDNPNVTKIWMTGSLPAIPGSPMKCTLHILGSNMERFDQDITDEQVQSLDIPEAIEFINHL